MEHRWILGKNGVVSHLFWLALSNMILLKLYMEVLSKTV